jgi:replicative DNA helicase
LKGLAKQINAPFLLLAQLSREVEKRPSKRPQLADLRETGNAEQDADIVMFLMRPEYYGLTLEGGESSEGIAQVIVAKHRNGPTGEFNCHFNKTRAQFGDMAQMFSGGQF